MRMRHAARRVVLLGSVAVLLASCGTLSSSRLDQDHADQQRYALRRDLAAEVDSLVQPLIASGHSPGMVVGVLNAQSGTQFFGYGVADKLSGRVPTADTLFAVGSLSKGFLGALTAVLVDEGVLRWDERLADSLPPGTELSADARGITVEQLVTHTSGLPRQPMNLRTLSYFAAYLFTGRSFYRHFDEDYVLDYLASFEAPAGPPQPVYSNIGMGLLGRLIERRTGRELEDLLQEKLLTPLQLLNTGYHPELLPGYELRAHGHAGDQPKFIARGRAVPDWQFTPLMKGSAALYSDARELLRFADAHLHPERGPLQRRLSSNLEVRLDREREAAAVGWLQDRIDGVQISYQKGFVAGYTSYLGLDRERGNAVVVLQNSFNWTDEVGHRLLLRLARATPPTVAARSPADSDLFTQQHPSFNRQE